MTIYRKFPPSHLMAGTITDIAGSDTANPRYLVSLSDTNHPVPADVYAWAAEDRSHQTAAARHQVGDDVIMQDIGGVLSIVRNASQGAPNALPVFPFPYTSAFPPQVSDSSLSYDTGSELRINTTGSRLGGNNSVLDVNQHRIGAYTLDDSYEEMHAVISGQQSLALRNSGMGMITRNDAFVFGNTPEDTTQRLHQVVVQNIDSTGRTFNIGNIQPTFNLDANLDTGEVSGTITVDLRPYFTFADVLRVSGDGVSGGTGSAPSIERLVRPTINFYDTNITYLRYVVPPAISGAYVAVMYGTRTIITGTPGGPADFMNSSAGILIVPTHAYTAHNASGPVGGAAGVFIPMFTRNAAVAAANVARAVQPMVYPAIEDVLRDMNNRPLLTSTDSPDTMIRTGMSAMPRVTAGPVRQLYYMPAADLLLGWTPTTTPAPSISRIILDTFQVILVDWNSGRQLTNMSDPALMYAVIEYDGDVRGNTPVAVWGP